MVTGPATTTEERPVVSVILATLNERANLPELFERLRTQPLPSYEVVVVDDGSTDGTREFVQSLATGDARVRPVFHDGKQTTVRAQCQGIANSTGELVVIMDADLQHPPETIPALLTALAADRSLVLASRYAPGGSPGRRSAYRALLSWGAEWIARRRLPETRRVSDPMSGFFAFRRSVFEPLAPEYRGYKLLLFLLVMNGARPIAEVPFTFAPRGAGRSKVTEGFGFFRVFLSELDLARQYRQEFRRTHPAPPLAGPPA